MSCDDEQATKLATKWQIEGGNDLSSRAPMPHARPLPSILEFAQDSLSHMTDMKAREEFLKV